MPARVSNEIHQLPARGSNEIQVTPTAQSFGAPEVIAATVETILRSIRASLGSPSADLRIFVCDPLGRLRLLAGSCHIPAASPARRKATLRSGLARFWSPEPGEEIAALPLEWNDHRFGVLEVRWTGSIEGSNAILEAAGAQAGALMHHLHERTEMEVGRATLSHLVELARKLVGARTPEGAIDETLHLLHDQLHLPVAAWLGRDQENGLDFAGAYGVGVAKKNRLHKAMPTFSRRHAVSSEGRTALVAAFAAATGAEEVAVVGAGDAVILVGGASQALRRCLDSAGELLRDVLEHLREVSQAKRRNEQFDFGIAMTAHELRGPITGTKATIEHLIMTNGYSPRQLALLNRSSKELQQLYDMVEGLLRWSVDDGDKGCCEIVGLGDVVTQAVATCGYETGDDRIRLATRSAVTVSADPVQLRVAIANLMRNALSYSPKDTSVRVSIDHREGVATIRVQDCGPGVSADERDAVFDPFVRGAVGRSSRAGKGLGLFIARRIIEAHGGTIWLQSSAVGTTFFVQLPAAQANPSTTSLKKQGVAS